jgi:hypothetical protein
MSASPGLFPASLLNYGGNLALYPGYLQEREFIGAISAKPQVCRSRQIHYQISASTLPAVAKAKRAFNLTEEYRT